MTEASLTADSYQILRQRLNAAATDLRHRFEQLNTERTRVFGTVETRLLSTLHVATNHNCIPRDLFSSGNRLLLGYNVQFGLQSDVHPKDVFTLFRIDQEGAHEEPLRLIADPKFDRDFAELYRYYKKTSFSRFHLQPPFLYMVFQVGKTPADVKAFKWLVDHDALRYVDNRSDADIKIPNQNGFSWSKATRDQHRTGVHPHIGIQDLVYVECVGGDLTIKVEDNTESGAGIYSEPVENSDQTLDDAEIFYCILGNLVLFKIRPYQEKEFRFLAYSIKRQQAMRLDGIRKACALLPDDHGIIFPTGILLQSGFSKIFDHGYQDLVFLNSRSAQNGEDYLYLFYQPESGIYLQFRYNLIRQEVDTPLVCHGQTIFDDGRMLTMRAQETPQKHHAIQVWQTPFVGPGFEPTVSTESMLFKIGNRDLVRCMAECQEILMLIDRDESYADLYVDIVKRTTDVLDGYFWLDRDETFHFNEPLTGIREAASAAIDEFEKVVRVRQETFKQTQAAEQAVDELVRSTERARFESVDEFVAKLDKLRSLRGFIIGLRDLKYVQLETVERLEQTLLNSSGSVGQRCVLFLLDPESLSAYRLRLQDVSKKVPSVATAAEGRELEKEIQKFGSDLELLIETISLLKIDDTTQRTAIIDRTGDLLAELNQVRSSLRSHVRQLLSGEMEADFGSQLKLLDQAVSGYLDTADSPEKIDQTVTKVLLQIEELETRFAEFDPLMQRLHQKRESILEAFESRRVQLVEARTKRADSLAAAAERVLSSIASRTLRIDQPDALRSFLASDPMVDKARRISEQLREMGDTVRMEEILSKLKSIGDDAFRQQRDRKDLFSSGNQLIRLGNHSFAVNQQNIELTTVLRHDQLWLHITGTQYFEPLVDSILDESRDLWSQAIISESPLVYRAEYLAASLFDSLAKNADEQAISIGWFRNLDESSKIEWVRAQMQAFHNEGYARGIHDRDGALVLSALIQKEEELGILRHSSSTRAAAHFAWSRLLPSETRERLDEWLASFKKISALWPKSRISVDFERQLADAFREHAPQVIDDAHRHSAVEYMIAERLDSTIGFPVSPKAAQMFQEVLANLTEEKRLVLQSVFSVNQSPWVQWCLALNAVDGYLAVHSNNGSVDADRSDPLTNYREELALLLLVSMDDRDKKSSITHSGIPSIRITGLAGDHPKIESGEMLFHYHEFMDRLGRYRRETVTRFAKLQSRKLQLLELAHRRLRIEDMGAKVLTSFVRNRLIDQVFLPRIGDNLAKQLGAAGENKRSDRMGLLLLISPPGYGKTTLMEYVANRLGLVFMKINGPALGHQVVSLDPAEAKNASAKEEVRRINLALEMGDNVLLYLDDIQHCNTELLQKFIPLCDASRRIEGVWQDEPKTYDLRGRRFAVVMAGNPYTESGQLFQIPDMLANRADVYNLGEMIGGAAEAFEMSYLENSLTSNPSLLVLARASTDDQQKMIVAAQRGSLEGIDLEINLSSDQRSEIFAVLQKLLRVRDVVVRVNREYIRSAAQADSYRTEPPFKLQGSYRNMNRIAEKISPIMNEQEVELTILSSYEQDAQTLTSDSESNMLKFRELMGTLSEAQRQRWENIKYAYVESIRMAGLQGDDQSSQFLKSLVGLKDGLESIRRTISEAATINRDKLTGDIQVGLEFVEQRMDGIASKIEDILESQARAIRDAHKEQRELKLPDQKVLVQHSVPRVITDLVKSQFQLLYDGLRPILEHLSVQSEGRKRLGQAMDDCFTKYKELEAELTASETSKEANPPPIDPAKD